MLSLLGLVSLLAVGGVLATIVGIVWFGRFAGTLPSADELTARSVFQTTPVYAANGTTRLYEITDPSGGRRTVVPLDQIPRTFVEATIATEDPSFFSNPGFEIRSIIRATFDDFIRHQIVSGASTITQQVVRNALLSPKERQDLSARRKIREIILAYQLAHTYTKDEILQVYLNEINYGDRNYGVEAAAEGYFGKTAANLDLAESALLAGIPQAPSYYNPYLHFEAVKDRQNYVLQRMVIQGYITPAQAEAAAAEPLHLADHRHALVAPHFVAYVSDQLSRQLSTDELYQGGDRVTTTLDLGLQQLAENAVRANLGLLKSTGGNNAAVVVLDPRDGRILAMVGSANYDDATISGEVNMAVAPLASGGVLTPLTYALALMHGDTLITRFDNVVPGGALGRDVGPTSSVTLPTSSVTLAQALGLGLDVPAMQVMRTVGNQNFIDLGTKLGISDFNRRVAYGPNYTIAGARVSPLEVAEAYGLLANRGVARHAYAIDRIVRPNGQVAGGGPSAPVPAVDPGAAYLVTTVLADPAERPPGESAILDVGTPVAARLTQSDNKTVGWAAGYTQNLVVVVWTGNAQGTALTSSEAAGRIWSSFVREALKLRSPVEYPRPADVIDVSLCKNPGCTQKYDQLALRGTEKAIEATNARVVAKPSQPATGSSVTPLLNRQPLPNSGAVAATSDVVIPNVVGLSVGTARELLAGAGLTSTPLIQYESGARIPPAQRGVRVGQVIATSPPANQRVASGSSVLLIVRKD